MRWPAFRAHGIAILLTLLSQQQYQLRLRYMHDHLQSLFAFEPNFSCANHFGATKKKKKKKLTNQPAAVFVDASSSGSAGNYLFDCVCFSP